MSGSPGSVNFGPGTGWGNDLSVAGCHPVAAPARTSTEVLGGGSVDSSSAAVTGCFRREGSCYQPFPRTPR